MKKFTSLFALLSCLCVVSAQAGDVTIYVDASNIADAKLYWWGATTKVDFDKSPLISSLDYETINGTTFYKKTLTPTDANAGVSVIFWQWNDDNGKTSDITNLKASQYYYKYNGGKNYTAAIVSLGITGPFNSWSTTTDKFSYVNGAWTYILEPQDANNIAFKIIPNGYWAGFTGNTIQPSEWFQSDDDGNIVLKHSSLQKSEYKLTATWNPSWDAISGWTLKAEGVNADQYTIGSTTYTIGETNTVDLSNDPPFSTATNFTATTATYTRSNGDNQWGTLCLPFAITNPTSGVTFYQLSNVANNVMTFTPYATSTIPAGTPIAFKLDEGNSSLSINETNATVTGTPGSSTGDWTMKGTFQRKTLNGIYYIYNDKYYYGSNITAKPYRAWIEGTAPANSAPFRIEVDGEQSLQFVEQEDGTVKAYYDLQGRKLDGARKGLVIENGKIIMVK